ncbi:Fic/DOC family protein [Gluconobacter albidus]|uniref:Fic/DOC family protein n=1 Tax=Gluconobacter albidus TaxID=318683 RepID=UPI0007810479|nr:Fic family protein [Gluconobacter albidus]
MSPAHSYTYPNVPNDPDQTDVLRNRLGLRRHSELHPEEYRRTSHRILQISLGQGPTGRFDVDHLKAIHRHIFQDVYEWAGHMRHERPVVDGAPVEPIGSMRKGTTAFLPGSQIDMGLAEAFRPIRNPDVLKNSTPAQFASIAGKVLNELNYVHPFREGNGRAQETFIAELGRHYGYDVDLSVITKARMVSASIAGTHDPDHPAMARLLRDATDPTRSRALKGLMRDLQSSASARPLDDIVFRTAAPRESVSGTFRARTDLCGAFETPSGIVAVPLQDLRTAVRQDGGYVVQVRSDFGISSLPAPLRPVPPPPVPLPFGPSEERRERALVTQALEDGRKAAGSLHAFWSAPPSRVCRDIEVTIREEGGDADRVFTGMKAGGRHAALGNRPKQELRENSAFAHELSDVQDAVAAYGDSRRKACAFGAALGREAHVLTELAGADREIARHATRIPGSRSGHFLLQTLSDQPSLSNTADLKDEPSPSAAHSPGLG